MKKGFTLIELLGVIVILGLIALIAIPTINSSLNASKSRAYDEQITTIENVARTYMSKKSLLLPNQIVGSHTCIKVSDLKKVGLLTMEDLKNPKYKEGSSREDEKFKTFNGGVVVTYTKKNKYNYKYSNDLEKCEAGLGDKESGDTAIPNLSISVSFNTNYITVVANAFADSGIVKYEFSKDNGTTWIDNGTEKIYTFKNLIHGTSYNIKVRVTSGAGRQNTAFKRVVIPSLSKPTFKESGTSVKTVTITYPAGCGSTYNCSYVKDNGSSVNVTTSTVDVPFKNDGTVVGKVSDGVNAVSSSYTVEFSPVMMKRDTSKAFWQSTYRDKISTVDVLDNKNVPSTVVASWDVSEKQNKSVMAWIIDDPDNSGMYKLYIGGKGKVIAPADSSRLFYGYNSSFSKTKTMNLAKLDTSRVTNMNAMFYACSSLTNLDVSNFNTSKVTNMNAMFRNCSSLTSLDVSKFNTSNVTDMSYMFYECRSLTSLDVSNFDTRNVTNMGIMFYVCSKLTNLDVSNFDTSNVTDMGGMFAGCSSLTSLDVSNFITSKVTNMNAMFNSCKSFTSLDLSNFDTSNVKNMSHMFSYCESLTSLDVSKFDTSKVTGMSQMFNSCKSLTSLDVSNFDTSNVTNMSQMFYNCRSLTSLDLSNFDTSNVKNMSHMFSYCESLTSLDVSKFDTSKVTGMSEMFEYCSKLTNLDLSSFDTSKVTNMFSMFDRCSSLTSLDLSKFDTSNVTNMSQMFYYCRSLTNLNVSNFDTSKVTSMKYMFDGCNSLTSLKLCSFDTSKVTNMDYMFRNTLKLPKVYVGPKWTTANATTNYMFSGSGVSAVTQSNTCELDA